MRIDEMPAGREMDKAIGQHIFKYWVDHYDKDYAENCYYCLMDGSGDAVIPGFYGERKTEEEAWNDCPEFSTDIAAAWEVWDYLKNKYHELILSWCYDMYYLLACDSKGHYLFSSETDTVPHAISRIALKAMGVTEI